MAYFTFKKLCICMHRCVCGVCVCGVCRHVCADVHACVYMQRAEEIAGDLLYHVLPYSLKTGLKTGPH